MIMSVHPILQSAPRATSSHLKNGRKIPFVTVVTDLGEAHPWWFNKKLDALFVPTQAMKDQGIQLGLKGDNIHVCGLPLVRANADTPRPTPYTPTLHPACETFRCSRRWEQSKVSHHKLTRGHVSFPLALVFRRGNPCPHPWAHLL